MTSLEKTSPADDLQHSDPKCQTDSSDGSGDDGSNSKNIKETSKSKNIRSKFLKYITSLFPIGLVVRKYKFRQYILSDVMSGISAGCLQFPQGIAYGLLASLAPANGLYTSFFPVIIYVVFGTSAHASYGPDAVIAMITAEMVDMAASEFHTPAGNVSLANATLAADEALLEFKVATAASATLLVGAILLLMGLFKLGFLTTYLSTAFIGGFTAAAAFHIATSQVNKALGFEIPIYTGVGKMVKMYIAIVSKIAQTNVASILTAVISILVLILVKDCINERYKSKLKMPVPIDLIVVVVTTMVSHFGNFADNFQVKMVGHIPSGVPLPRLPNFTATGSLISTVFILAVLILFLNIAMAKVCAKKHGYEIDDNQELVAYGLCNFGSSFFHCIPSCISPARTMILSDMGANTTLNGISTAVFVLVVILGLGQFLVSLPIPVLAAMIMVLVKGLLMSVRNLPMLWRINRYDCITWIATCSSGILLDLPYGLGVGLVCSLLTVVVQSQMSRSYVLKKLDGEERFVSAGRKQSLAETPRVKIFRMESSLYFATTDVFRKRLYKATVDPRILVKLAKRCASQSQAPVCLREEESVNGNLTTIESIPLQQTNQTLLSNTEIIEEQVVVCNQQVTHVVIDCLPINYLDLNGVALLAQIFAEYRQAGISVYLARCSSYMLNVLDNTDFYDNVSRECIFTDLDEALAATMTTPDNTVMEAKAEEDQV